MNKETFYYDNRIVRAFAWATLLWGVVGMLVGLIVSMQLFLPELNLTSWLSFGRIRPLHTNAVIFAFVGNAIFTGVYYSLQRLLKARMFSDALSNAHFWMWQLIIVAAAITLPLGISTSKEYAELEWPIDIAITLTWVVFGINMFGTIIKRREKHIYVGIWFYIATWVTVAMLHIVNSFELPVSFLKSYSVFSGVQDALVQWWYGHNAVAFFLTTPFLGMMYYFMPKMANRPVYSYKLSILHFWSLIFIYIWAGPHHLLYSSLPDWAQMLGVIFSVMLIAPSWGGMINGLLTLRGAWDKVREDAILKFMVVGLVAYGMATFEGPLLSLKTFNAMAHFTDWVVAHVHVGGLGWNGFVTFAILYWMIPRMWGTKLYSQRMANQHFWIGTLGILFYAVPMYFSGFSQGFMWKEFDASGNLKYNFLETVERIKFLYMLRSFGGLLYLSGVFLMVYNLVKTVKQGSFIANEQAEAYALDKAHDAHAGKPAYWHKWIETRPMTMLLFSLIMVSIGGMVQLVPMIFVKEQVKTISSIKPYSPLELEGRDLYIREGCNNCHSQLVRPFRSETERYGEYSKSGEYVYDHPFLWGSKRTGPDLVRGGDKAANKVYKNATWHYMHMLNPRETSPGSIMPAYPWLIDNSLDMSLLEGKIKAMRTLGVPYEKGYEKDAKADLMKQAEGIVAELKKDGYKVEPDKEIVAMIAYLHKLGRDLKPAGEVADNK
ncbi:MAG: cytochrome-c oxidase, cbb3-type subunit I [Bacteroidia bacterium]|jgi:cytochrome c oxidase cbb3-type subunit I/II